MFGLTNAGKEDGPASPNIGYHWKLVLLTILLLLDVATLTTGDYEFQPGASKAAMATFILSFVSQLGVMSVMYLLLAATFPFKVGLVGLLTSRLFMLLVVTIVYLILNILSGGMRVFLISTEGMGPKDLLETPFFVAISSITKLIAPLYYAMNLRAAFELGDPAYYTEDAWGKAVASLIEGRARLAEKNYARYER